MDNHKVIFLLSFFVLLWAILFSYFNIIPFLFMNLNQILPTFGVEFGMDIHPQIYIVNVVPPTNGQFNSAEERENWHKSFLPSTALASGEPRMIYSFKHVISGFAARLTRKEVRAMESLDGFLSAYPDQIHTPCTTYSPKFLGLQRDVEGLWKDTNYGGGIIIGVLDTGIRPSHHSFKDDGVPDKPEWWHGKCFDPSFCNKKVIAAIGINHTEEVSPVDDNGHGTHTASTAAGNFVEGANILGLAYGTASGTAPRAHLAIYKVCFPACPTSIIMEGIDKSLEDGVHLLSISISNAPKPFYENGIAQSTFKATTGKGILVTTVAGNYGPARSSVHHDAPWVLTVGASTTDRSLRVKVKLGNETELEGESAYQPEGFQPILRPLIYPGAAGDENATYCEEKSLEEFDVEGKVVMCSMGGSIDPISKGRVVQKAKGAAMILMNTESGQSTIFSFPHVLPASAIAYSDSLILKEYYAKTTSPTAAIIFEGTQFNIPAPTVAVFSGRGPSNTNGGILKPDIIGPGVNILAADHTLDSSFRMDSGTSMAAPHLAGIAGLLKVKHPLWSPAEIKSAIMTSSDYLNREGKPITDETSNAANLFAIGAGHVNPAKASDPGLVYDIKTDDYIRYLCGLNYTDIQVRIVTQSNVSCSDPKYEKIDPEQLNYPSIALSMKPGSTRIVRRKVKNVGTAVSTYKAEVIMSTEVQVNVSPGEITFTELDKEESFDVQFTAVGGKKEGSVYEGHLIWVSEDKKYKVRSSISITFT